MAEKKENNAKNYFWDNLGVIPCSLEEAKRVALLCFECHHVPVFVSETGIGKSQAARQIAESQGWRVVFLFLAHLEPEDISGIPYPNNGSGTYAFLCENTIKSVIDSNQPTLLVLDEWNRGEKAVMNAAFTMMEDRRFGGFTLPKHVRIMACMNPSEENYLVNEAEKDPAFRRRLCFVGIQPDPMVWLGYAKDKFHPFVVDYIRRDPSALVDIQARDAGKIASNPASWEKVSQTLQWMDTNKIDIAKHITTLKYKIAGHIGFGQTDNFMTWLRDRESLIDPSLIFKYDTVQGRVHKLIEDGRNDRLSVLIDSLSLTMVESEKLPEKSELDGFVQFIQDLPLEFAKALFQKLDTMSVDGHQGYAARLSIAMQGHSDTVKITRSIFGTAEKIEKKFKEASA